MVPPHYLDTSRGRLVAWLHAPVQAAARDVALPAEAAREPQQAEVAVGKGIRIGSCDTQE